MMWTSPNARPIEHRSKERIAPVPRALSFLRPTSIEEAVAMLSEHGDEAKVVAGSTAVTIMLRNRLIDPSVLVSIGRLPGLSQISAEDGYLTLGSLATHRDVELNPIARERIPVLTDTFHKVANVRVRNVTAVRVPVPQPGTRAVYEKFVTRSSEDRPCIGVAASIRLTTHSGIAEDVRVAVGAASETPQRFPDLERTAVGKEMTEDLARSIAEGYAERIDTLDDMRGSAWYRTEMVKVWVRRALMHALV